MRKDKEKATDLRKEGKSYKEIKGTLQIPISTLSDWFGKEDWSRTIKQRLAASAQEGSTIRLLNLNKTRSQKLVQAYEDAREEARKEFDLLKYNPVFISGIMLYWGEGAKDPKQGVKLTNSDPKMIRFYVSFLTTACHIPIEKIKAHILIYPQIDEKTARAYWSKMANVPWENFTKTIVLEGRHATKRLGWGACTITISNNYLKQKMLEWIRLLPEELLRAEYYANI